MYLKRVFFYDRSQISFDNDAESFQVLFFEYRVFDVQ